MTFSTRFLPTLLAIAATMLTAFGAIADTYHDKPDSSATGGIVGQIKPADGLQAVIAVDPIEFKAYSATLDANGRFVFRGLPPAEYDLLIKTTGKVYEGLSLEANQESSDSAGGDSSDSSASSSSSGTSGTSATIPASGSANSSDLRAIAQDVGKTFFTSEDYFNRKRIVRLSASGDRAHLFVIQTRTKPVLDPAGNAIHATIRRFDYVEMIKTRKLWQLARSRHLLRQEVPFGSPDAEVKAVHSPQLGAILVGEKVKDLGAIDLMKLSPSPAGRYGSAEWEGK